MPNVMAAQLNVGGALCESSIIPCTTPQSLAGVSCSNAVNTGERKTWTQSEFLHLTKLRQGQKPPKVHI